MRRNKAMKKNKKAQVTQIIWGIVVIILIIILFGTFYIIDPGQRGIIVRLGQPLSEISEPGFHFKAPFVDHLIRMNVRTQTINFDNQQGKGDITEDSSLFAASKDLQDVQIAVVINYHINPQDVMFIYTQYGDSTTYENNILRPMVREAVKSTSAKYTAEELVTKRVQYSDDVSSLLQQRMQDKQAIFDGFKVVNFEFSQTFTLAIEAKVTAEQNALRAKNQLEQIKYEAQQRIEQAKGESEAIAIQVHAINQQGGQNYIALQTINRWDGKLPVVMGSNSVPFIDMRTLGMASAATYTSTYFVNNSVNQTQ